MTSRRKQRYLLPDEYLGNCLDPKVMAEALRRGRPMLWLFWSITIAAYVYGGLLGGHWGWNLCGVAISGGFGLILWRDLVTGHTCSNLGAFLRGVNPIRYWLTIGFLVVGYAGGLAGMLLDVQST